MAIRLRNIFNLYKKLSSNVRIVTTINYSYPAIINNRFYTTKGIEKPSLDDEVDRLSNVNNENTIHLTDSCVKRIKEIVEKDQFLRVIIEGGGCSGFQYKFEIDEKINDDDKIFMKNDVKVVVDNISFEFIKGSTVDFHVELIRSAFVISNNPNAEQGCSCGASFTTKI